MPLPTFNFMQPVMQHDLSNLGNIFGNYYKGYEQARTPQRLAQEELSRNLYNEIQKVDLRYKPQQYESQIGHTNAQTGLTREQMKWLGPEKMAQIRSSQAMAAEHEAKTEKLRRQQAFIQQILAEQGYGGQGGEMGMSAQQPQSNQMPQFSGMPGGNEQSNIFGPQAASQLPQGGMPGMTQQQDMQPQQRKPISPLAESLMAQIMGIDPIKPIVNTENELVQPSLFGGEPKITKIGPSEAEREFKKISAHEEAKGIHEEKTQAINRYEAESAKEPVLRELMDIVNHPAFTEATGPISGILSQFSTDPAVHETLGKLDYALGDLVNRSSRQFGKNLNRAEYSALERMKGNKSQQPMAIKSKVLLTNALSQFDKQVSKNYYNNLSNGMDRLEAKEQAYKDVDYSAITKVVKTDDLAYKIANNKKSDYESVMKAAEEVARIRGIEVLNVLEDLNKGKK